MSVSLKFFVHRLLVVLPVVLAVLSLAMAAWFGTRVRPLTVPPELVLPATLTRLPEQGSQSAFIRSVLLNGEPTGPDPFVRELAGRERPGSEQGDAELLDIHLTLVARGAGGRICQLNGMLVREGDVVAGCLVQQVLAREVQLRCGREEFVLLPGQKAVLAGGLLREIIEVRDQEPRPGVGHPAASPPAAGDPAGPDQVTGPAINEN